MEFELIAVFYNSLNAKTNWRTIINSLTEFLILAENMLNAIYKNIFHIP